MIFVVVVFVVKLVLLQGAMVNKGKWAAAGVVLDARGERHKDVMDIFQVRMVVVQLVYLPC